MPGSCEFRVSWQREGQAKKHALYQTRKGAEDCAKRQCLAADEMDWLPATLADIVWGPLIQVREVTSWKLAATDSDYVSESAEG